MNRRHFIQQSAALGTLLTIGPFADSMAATSKKMKLAMVGTGSRGLGFWGRPVLKNYGEFVEFVGLCDTNPGRLEYARKALNVKAAGFSDFEQMMKATRPDMVLVTTVDADHHTYIIKALEMGADVLTEKPMTTTEEACRLIADAEKKTGKKVRVGMNYRYGAYFSAIKEVLNSGRIGKITSVDFHWYLNTYHGADYFRRWHRLKEKGGTLLCHKSSHHFDLINWFLDADPVQVSAFGSLEHYGKNGLIRHTHCRPCPHKTSCRYHFDITKRTDLMELYVANEHYDGYLRDGCVFKEDIDIYDKMSVQALYANKATLNYSLTTYSPYEGWRIAFNGTEGRIDASEGIPWEVAENDQATLHDREMKQTREAKKIEYDEIFVSTNFKKETEKIRIERIKEGHGGGDARLLASLFSPTIPADPLKWAAGTRDGTMSVLVGVAARKSIEEKRIVAISELTDLKLEAKRP